jgi:ATP-binding cassette subfamily C protein CydCD
LLVILLAPEVYRPLREVAARFHASADATAVINDVDQLLTGNFDPAAPPADADRSPSANLDQTGEPAFVHLSAGTARRAVGVVAQGVRVRYSGAATDALSLSGLQVGGGELVAVRGVSGAGKTTLLRVLAGIQEADSGTVEVAGPPVLYLPQRPVLPHARTVADVFAAAGVAGEAIPAALRVVGLDDEVGRATPLGEHGQGVSAGQRQRLALAALLWRARAEPVVLLLDEPTAHLDARTERMIIVELRAAAARGGTSAGLDRGRGLRRRHRPALATGPAHRCQRPPRTDGSDPRLRGD